MDATDAREQVARVLVLFVVVAIFNNFRRGQLPEWAAAKLWNASAPKEKTSYDPGAVVASSAAGAAGVITEAGLVQVGSTRMSARFAARWVPLAAAARKDGIVLEGGAYRTADQQIALRKKNCGTSAYAIYEMPSRQCRPPTARPGTSNHETGDAIDVTSGGASLTSSSAAFKWLSRNAGKFGVYNLPSEPWHWSIDGN